MDTKRWFQSKGVWGGIAAVLAGLLKGKNIDVTDLLPSLIDNLDAVLAFVGGIVAIVGRVRASKVIAPKDGNVVGGAPRLPLLGALLLPALLFTSCAERPTYVAATSPVAIVGSDFNTAAAQAIEAYRDYKAGNHDLTWALQKAFDAYSVYAKTAPDVKALVKAWTGNAGDSQELADKLARIFGSSTAPPETKMAALAEISRNVASDKGP